MHGPAAVTVVAVSVLLVWTAPDASASTPPTPPAAECPHDSVGPRVRCLFTPDTCSTDAECGDGSGCCYRVCNKSCYPVCQPACGAGLRCTLHNDGKTSTCQPVCEPPCGAGQQCTLQSQGRTSCQATTPAECPYDSIGPLVRCAFTPDDCASDAECGDGRGCCYRVCNKSCYPVCQPACADGLRCILQGEGRMSTSSCQPVCEPSCGAGQQCTLQGKTSTCQPTPPPPPPAAVCPYDDLGPRVRCAGRRDACSSDAECAHGRGCCFRGCNKSCQPVCGAPCGDGLRCTLRGWGQTSSSSCQPFTPLQ